MLCGLTGGIGCGKSTVLGILRSEGLKVLESDQIVHELLTEIDAIEFVREEVGVAAIVGGAVDRKALAEIVFKNEEKLRLLENFLHPKVFASIEKSVSEAKDAIWIVEIPVLFERGYENRFDKTICVGSSKDVQFKRLMGLGYTEADVNARLASQMPLDRKLEKADYVIWNDGSLEGLKMQVLELIRVLKSR